MFDGVDGVFKILVVEYEDVKFLVEELIDIVIDLFFFFDLMVIKVLNGKFKVIYSIW